jgi:hypothetical protein
MFTTRINPFDKLLLLCIFYDSIRPNNSRIRRPEFVIDSLQRFSLQVCPELRDRTALLYNPLNIIYICQNILISEDKTAADTFTRLLFNNLFFSITACLVCFRTPSCRKTFPYMLPVPVISQSQFLNHL